MKYGECAVAAALGCVLAHSVKLADGSLRKGAVLGAADIRRLAAAGLASVVVARLEPGDVGEDEAARQVAAALAGNVVEQGQATTGRVNLHAAADGLLVLDVARIDAANRVHEAITIATLPPESTVTRGQMLATIKIIPYAVPQATLARVLQRLQGDDAPLAVAAWQGLRVGLVLTDTAALSASVRNKMQRSVLQRLEPLGASLAVEVTVPHEEGAVAGALASLMQDPSLDLLLVSGAAATVDRGDVVPAAVVRAGGQVLHAGMPVDPGNLLVLAQMPRAGQACPVVGIPTCARSPKLNGFDFVLRRFAAGLAVTAAHLMGMGVGGLLTEIESRPMPRDTRT